MRIEIPVHYDLWMRGARTGTVVAHRRNHWLVRMDHPQVGQPAKVKVP